MRSRHLSQDLIVHYELSVMSTSLIMKQHLATAAGRRIPTPLLVIPRDELRRILPPPSPASPLHEHTSRLSKRNRLSAHCTVRLLSLQQHELHSKLHGVSCSGHQDGQDSPHNSA